MAHLKRTSRNQPRLMETVLPLDAGCVGAQLIAVSLAWRAFRQRAALRWQRRLPSHSARRAGSLLLQPAHTSPNVLCSAMVGRSSSPTGGSQQQSFLPSIHNGSPSASPRSTRRSTQRGEAVGFRAIVEMPSAGMHFVPLQEEPPSRAKRAEPLPTNLMNLLDCHTANIGSGRPSRPVSQPRTSRNRTTLDCGPGALRRRNRGTLDRTRTPSQLQRDLERKAEEEARLAEEQAQAEAEAAAAAAKEAMAREQAAIVIQRAYRARIERLFAQAKLFWSQEESGIPHSETMKRRFNYLNCDIGKIREYSEAQHELLMFGDLNGATMEEYAAPPILLISDEMPELELLQGSLRKDLGRSIVITYNSAFDAMELLDLLRVRLDRIALNYTFSKLCIVCPTAPGILSLTHKHVQNADTIDKDLATAFWKGIGDRFSKVHRHRNEMVFLGTGYLQGGTNGEMLIDRIRTLTRTPQVSFPLYMSERGKTEVTQFFELEHYEFWRETCRTESTRNGGAMWRKDYNMQMAKLADVRREREEEEELLRRESEMLASENSNASRRGSMMSRRASGVADQRRTSMSPRRTSLSPRRTSSMDPRRQSASPSPETRRKSTIAELRNPRRSTLSPHDPVSPRRPTKDSGNRRLSGLNSTVSPPARRRRISSLAEVPLDLASG
eukprot:m.55689 g.55689  ORF g.55689 m.55689 type:complete len:667 (-) comp6949_c0_seq1:899-2899(-)